MVSPDIFIIVTQDDLALVLERYTNLASSISEYLRYGTDKLLFNKSTLMNSGGVDMSSGEVLDLFISSY